MGNWDAELLKTELSANGIVRVRLLGTSMGPFIKNGDMAIIKKIEIKDIHIGDVILYHIGEDFFTHRVFKKGNSFLTLKADAVTGVDRYVSFEEVMGKVVAIEKKNRILDLQSSKWRIINYFILFYSLGLSTLRDCRKDFIVPILSRLGSLSHNYRG